MNFLSAQAVMYRIGAQQTTMQRGLHTDPFAALVLFMCLSAIVMIAGTAMGWTIKKQPAKRPTHLRIVRQEKS